MKKFCSKLVLALAPLLLFSYTGSAQAPTATVSVTNTTCGLSNGSAQANPSGGTGTYTYRWSPGNVTTPSRLNQPGESGNVTVYSGTDSVVVPYTIGSSTAPTVSIAASRDTVCLSEAYTLTATASGAGGTYTWTGGALTSPYVGDPLTINSSLIQQKYRYTVSWTDAAGQCTATNTDSVVAIYVGATLSQVHEPSCGANTGSISCGVSGVRFECTYYKSGVVIQTGSATSINNLLPGEYSFTVQELSSGCSATVDSIILVDSTSYANFAGITVNPETCFGQKNGSITVNVANCASGCVYTWSQSSTDVTDSATGLTAGSYKFSVNKNGCSNIDTTIIVPGPASKLVDTLRVHTDHCNKSIGSGIVLSGGGTPPYSYVWSEGTPATTAGDSVSSIHGYSRDTVIVMDSHGCADTLSDSIGNTPGPSARITNTDTICTTESNGVLIVQATSSDGPFTYVWSNGSSTTVAGGLTPGAYTVDVINAVGCDTLLTGVVYAYPPNITLSALPTAEIYTGQTVELLVQVYAPVTGVHWTPYVPGSTGSLDVYDKPTQSTQYTVIVDYGQACQLFDTVMVTVLEDTTKMVVPNVFTPNGDGINDNFLILSWPASLVTFHMWVYDRWGNKVYETTDINFNWNGTDIFVANKPLSTGVYAYAIEYMLSDVPDKKVIGGNISLVK